jgi:hypothetical protein
VPYDDLTRYACIRRVKHRARPVQCRRGRRVVQIDRCLGGDNDRLEAVHTRSLVADQDGPDLEPMQDDATAAGVDAEPQRPAGVCCVERKDRSRTIGYGVSAASEAQGEIVERHPDPIMGGRTSGEFVMAAADVLHERVPGRDRAQ